MLPGQVFRGLAKCPFLYHKEGRQREPCPAAVRLGPAVSLITVGGRFPRADRASLLRALGEWETVAEWQGWAEAELPGSWEGKIFHLLWRLFR